MHVAQLTAWTPRDFSPSVRVRRELPASQRSEGLARNDGAMFGWNNQFRGYPQVHARHFERARPIAIIEAVRDALAASARNPGFFPIGSGSVNSLLIKCLVSSSASAARIEGPRTQRTRGELKNVHTEVPDRPMKHVIQVPKDQIVRSLRPIPRSTKQNERGKILRSECACSNRPS